MHLQRETFADYEDLVIAIGNGTTVGKNSIGLGDDTDAIMTGPDPNFTSKLEPNPAEN